MGPDQLSTLSRSGFNVRSEDEIDDLASSQLQSFPRLALFDLADLEAAGFEVAPTFRTPHVTIVFTGDLDARLRDLTAARSEVRSNPYHELEQRPVDNEEEDR